MGIDLARYEELKSSADKLQRDIDRAEGVLQERLSQLKAEFNCSTLEEAQSLLENKRAKAIKAKEQFDKALNQFEEEWGEVLADNSSQQPNRRRQ
jgi:hypothetical protein